MGTLPGDELVGTRASPPKPQVFLALMSTCAERPIMAARARKSLFAGWRWANATGALVLWCGLAAGAAGGPPPLQCEFDGIVSGPCRLEGGDGSRQSGDSRSITASGLARRAVAPSGWYLAAGVQAENFFLPNDAGVPERLQDYAAVFSLEYYVGDEIAGAFTVHPGWYFAGHATAAAWDVPVDFAAGLPVTADLSGVLGFSNARFYHHALPVIGLIWTAGKRLRVEAVYPEPALVMSINRTTSLRLGGEVGGGGFLADEPSGRTVVEYVSYRVGAELSGTWRPGAKLTLGAGVEPVRSFDFFRRRERLHGGGGAFLKVSATFSR